MKFCQLNQLKSLACSMGSTIQKIWVFYTWEVLLSSFHRTEWGSASSTVSCALYNILDSRKEKPYSGLPFFLSLLVVAYHSWKVFCLPFSYSDWGNTGKNPTVSYKVIFVFFCCRPANVLKGPNQCLCLQGRLLIQTMNTNVWKVYS